MARNDRTILQEALDRFSAGESDAARAMIIAFVRANPADEEGWLSLSFVLDDPAKKADCLRRVLALNPNNLEARSALQELSTVRRGTPTPPPPSRPTPTPLILPGAGQMPPSPPAAKKAPPAKSVPPKQPPKSNSNAMLWWVVGGSVAVACLLLVIVFSLVLGMPAVPAAEEPSIEKSTLTPTIVITSPPKWTKTPTATVTPTPTVTSTPMDTPTPTLSPPDPTEMAAMDKVMKQVEDLRGLLPKKQIPMLIVDTSQAETILDQLLNDSGYPQQIDAEQRKLVALGFIKPTYDLKQYALTRLADNVAGFYVPTQQVLYVIGTQFGGVEKYVFSHEFDHALVFQNLASAFVNTDPLCLHDSQRCDAETALIEGDATLLMYQWMETYLSQQDLYDFYHYRTPNAPLAKDRNPPYAYYQVMFPYSEGETFAEYLYDHGNWARVNKAYANPPISTEQILHPAKYIAGEKPIPVSPADLSGTLGSPWVLETTDSLGEFSTYLMLAYGADYLAEVSEKDAYNASAGWGGDTYQVYYRAEDQATILVAHWIWDTPTDTAQFIPPMKKYLDSRFRGGSIQNSAGSCWSVNQQTSCIFSQGRHAVWVIAPDIDTVNAIHSQVNMSS